MLTDNLFKNDDRKFQLDHDVYNQVINVWNQTEENFPNNKTISQIFEDRANETPDNIALIYKNIKLTYKGLNEKANRLANHLLENYNIQPDDLVTLSLDRSEFMIIAILAILKSGAAYVPIEPSYPDERIAHILDDTRTPLIIINECYKGKIKHILKEKQINLNFLTMEDINKNNLLERYSELNINSYATSHNLAYVMYTSGTTGKPKGVMIEHMGVINYIYDLTARYKLSTNKNNEVILQFTNYVFDPSVEQIMLALLNGCKLLIIQNQLWLDKDKFYACLIKNKVTHIHATPTFLGNYDFRKISSLKRIISGAELLNMSCYKKLQFNNQIIVVNKYGPTETTINCIANVVEENDIRIGTPMANVKVYILDPHLSPVGIEEVGELYIGGVGLARGYLNLPELTLEKFIVNPFQSPEEKLLNKNARIYKTGDRFRWCADGKLEFIGRNDFQVKIGGHRIELLEIEVLLNDYPGIMQSVVIVKEISNKNKYLVGYYVSECEINQASIFLHLKNSLPSYMIPTLLIKLDKMPVNTNGKLDRGSLPESMALKNNYINTHSKPNLLQALETEENLATNYMFSGENILKLVNLWENILGIRPQNIEDNFFHLGGNSILMVKMLTLVQEQFDKKINVHRFLLEPTLKHLQSLLEDKNTSYSLFSHVDNDTKMLPHNDLMVATEKTDKAVLLTGATGFLGIHLLHQIAKQFTGNIYCLIRAKTIEDGINRLKASLTKYQLDLSKSFNRVIVILGDLAKPNLGINFKTWGLLANDVDYIFHNGAYVNHMYDYTTLKPVNVDSTSFLIELANTCRKKHIHFISTKNAEDGFIMTTGPKNRIINSFDSISGYTLSKLVAENILHNAWLNGTSVTIYRPGEITGSLLNGMSNFENNHALLLLKACIESGVSPLWKKTVDMLPVDIISNAIIKLSVFHGSNGQSYNLSNPNTLTWCEYINLVNQNGYLVKLITVDEWVNNYIFKLDESSPFYALKALYMNNSDTKFKDQKIEYSLTQSILNKIGITLPNDYRSMISSYLSTLAAKGFLPASNFQI